MVLKIDSQPEPHAPGDFCMNVPTQAPQPVKKGMSPLAWIGIGCGVIILIGFIALGAIGFFVKKKVEQYKDNPAMAAAELAIRANPDLELVSSDPKAGSLTVKDKKTGEVTTFKAEDLENGKFSITTKDGTTKIDASGAKDGQGATFKVTDDKGQEQVSTFGATAPQNLPSWVPTYPGGAVQGTFDTTGPQGRSAAFSVSTTDTTEKVIDWYESQLKGNGLEVQKSTYNANGQTGGMVSGKSGDEKRTVTVMIAAAEGKTQATVTFEEKK
jgi:hypothetical protein